MKKLFFTIELTLVAIVLTIGVCACSSEYADDETGSSVPPPYQKPEETPPAVTFFEVDGIYYNVTSQDDLTVEVTNSLGEKVNGTYLVLGWHGNYTGKVTIPEKVSYDEIEYTITAIGVDAFWYCTSLISIILPNGVTTIESSAFDGCTGLTEITIPDSVITIDSWAFSGCTGLTSVILGENVETIGSSAFWNCSGLTELNVSDGNPYYCDKDGVLFSKDMTTLVMFPQASPLMPSYDIPNSVTTIESYAFDGCAGLTSISIPNSVRTIEGSAFNGCTSLTGALNIPYGVITIGSCAFENCSSLTSLTIGNSVATIGSRAFRGCSGLTSVTISNGATSIESEAFYECTSLKELSLGNYVTSIGDYAFAYCYDINEIVIPSSTLNVGEYAFYGAGASNVYVYVDCREIGDYAFSRSGVEELTLGENVNSIGDYAFYITTKLKRVYSLNPEPPECGDHVFYYINLDTYVLYVPQGSYDAYSTADQWKDFTNIVEI